MRKDIQNVYENFDSIKAPPPIMESLKRVIDEMYAVTQIDVVEYQGDHIEDYPDPEAIDTVHESFDNVLTFEHRDELYADWQLNIEKNEQ